MLWTPVPPALTLGESEEDRTWEFLTVVGGSQAEAQACLTEALQLQAGAALYPAHAQAWAQLWAGCGLDVVGPLPLRQALRGALYYLLSALPQPGAPGYASHGLSPGGLSNGSREECYWGHVFWDQVCTVLPPNTQHAQVGQHTGAGDPVAAGTGVAAVSALPGMGTVTGEAQRPGQKGSLPGGGGTYRTLVEKSDSGRGTRRYKHQSSEGVCHLARATGALTTARGAAAGPGGGGD